MCNTSSALVGLGGYVPFGFTTQKRPEGGNNKTTFHPMVVLSTVRPLPYEHVAMPEFGIVFHQNNFDEVSKKTIFILWDIGWRANDRFVLRYGFGTFMTKISGKGGSITLSNGDSTMAFAAPDETQTSYNTTLNLGVDVALGRHYAFKAEAFIFGMMKSTSRAISYSLAFNYYM